MKTIIITRHAKSDWGNLMQKDYDRPLNERGLKDAPNMGKRLLTRGISIDKVVASTAKRAAQTANLIAAAIEYQLSHIEWHDKLYHAPPTIISEVIYGLDHEWNTVLLVAHNNGVTDFVNSLCAYFTDNMPTCAMAAFNIYGERWEDFATAKKELLFYDYPKSGFDLADGADTI